MAKHLKAGQLTTVKGHVYQVRKSRGYFYPCTNCDLGEIEPNCGGYEDRCNDLIGANCYFKQIK